MFKLGAPIGRGGVRSMHIIDVAEGLVREKNIHVLPLIPCHPDHRRRPDQRLLEVLRRARLAQDDVIENRHAPVAELARARGKNPSQYARLVKLNYLAPDIVAAIHDGLQPTTLTAARLLRARLPLDWAQQRELFGFAAQIDIGASGHKMEDWRRWEVAYGRDAPMVLPCG